MTELKLGNARTCGSSAKQRVRVWLLVLLRSTVLKAWEPMPPKPLSMSLVGRFLLSLAAVSKLLLVPSRAWSEQVHRREQLRESGSSLTWRVETKTRV